MHKKIAIALMVISVFVITGCGQKQADINAPQVQKNPAPKEQAKQSTMENTAPKTTNDLPTAIDETEKDLQVIDNDLKEIDKLNLNETDSEL